MPTQAVMTKFEELRSSIVSVLDLKRSLDRINVSIKNLKNASASASPESYTSSVRGSGSHSQRKRPRNQY